METTMCGHKIILTMAAMSIAATVMTSCGGGGGGSSTPAAITPSPVSTTIPITAANSPLIGVMMKVECANGISGQGPVGDSTNPGVGVITVSGANACTAPIKVTAIGSGTMRPIGAKSDGSEDMVYNPAVNLPISAIWMPPTASAMPTTSNPVIANPVTSLVAYQVAPAGITAAQLAAISPAMVNASKAAVASALGIAVGDIDKDYRSSAIAAASTRIVEVAGLAAKNSASSGLLPAGVGANKSLGQFIVERLAAAANSGASLTPALDIANVFLLDAGLNVTVDSAVATNGVIDNDATRVNRLITQAAIDAGITPSSVGAMLTQVANDPALATDVIAHIQMLLSSGALATTPPSTTVCKVAIGNAAAYVSGATACTTAYLNDDSGASTVTTATTPSGVIPYTFSSLATCTGLGAPPGVGSLTLVPCRV